MLIIEKGQDTEVILTLSENEVAGTHYLFVFTSRVTKEVLTLIIDKDDDLSIYQSRYNKLEIPMAVFAGKDEGIWEYRVYEQASDTNIDPTGLNLLEVGFIKLVSTMEEATMYGDSNQEFKVYNG